VGGFARVVTDYATYAYLADVFVLEPWRDAGIGQRLVEHVKVHPELQGPPALHAGDAERADPLPSLRLHRW
jgi:GNAT superfamily N-acetyltransferase